MEEVLEDRPLWRVWTTIKKMSGKRNEYGYPVRKDNDRLLVDNRSKAELLERAFAKVHSTENYCRNQRKRRNTKV